MTRYDVDQSAHVEGGSVVCDGPRELLLTSREVPLGGIRAMNVSRALPQRDLPMVGAWCFLDRFGPQVARMRVDPHPHIGLQTVTWPLVGEVRHRDAIGNDVAIRRGALNLMTAGDGISHSEYSIGDEPGPIDALQLWIALPESRRHGPRDFRQHTSLPSLALPALTGADPQITVVVGELGGVRSPAETHTPIVGAEVRLAPGSRVRLPFIPEWEYAITAIDGDIAVEAGAEGQPTEVHELDLLYVGRHRTGVEVSSEHGALLFLLGGEPFEDDIVMWWNFVGRSHEEIQRARDDWESQDNVRYGVVDGPHDEDRIPAPPLPNVRLTPRRRRV
ncbi:pirin family protein [Microbacterium sp. G2-8]|uniref:pirin family protein n=1 Tax=Microbacterium sp. G2-8 TaxID=2842454 RepID=UPI001C8B06BD|nr:pirin family protein [Microbacterium sp. G2-8]